MTPGPNLAKRSRAERLAARLDRGKLMPVTPAPPIHPQLESTARAQDFRSTLRRRRDSIERKR